MNKTGLLSTDQIERIIKRLNDQLDNISTQKEFVLREYHFKGKGRILTGMERRRKTVLSQLNYYHRLLRSRDES